MSVVVLLGKDGTLRKRIADQTKLHDELGGDVTFVGGIDDLHVFAVGRRTPRADDALNPLCSNAAHFDAPVKGDVILIGSDANGNAQDVDLDGVAKWFEQHIEE